MLYAATLPLKMIQSEPRLTYFPYAEIALLDRYLGDSQAPYSERKQRAAIAIYHLLHDLLSFESLSIVGYQPYQQARMIVETSLERIRKIERPFRSVRNLSDLVGADPASKEIRH
jgi:hypothetical protein